MLYLKSLKTEVALPIVKRKIDNASIACENAPNAYQTRKTFWLRIGAKLRAHHSKQLDKNLKQKIWNMNLFVDFFKK